MITSIYPSIWTLKDTNTKLVIDHPILTEPSKKRTGIIVKVKSLNEFLPKLQKEGVQIEHLYDY